MMSRRYISSFWPESDGSTLSLDFTTGVLDPRLTFTRASTTATYINSSGYVTTAGTNVPRFDHDPTTRAPRGLLVEGSATNLLTYSEDYSQVAWTKSVVDRTTGQSSPDGTTGATLISENATSYAKHGLERTQTITAGVHTFSVWLKEPSTNSRRYACIQLADGQATAARYTIVADLQTGTITASGATNGTAGAPTNTAHSISTAYPGGWYRVTITMNFIGSASYPVVLLSDISTLFGGPNQPFYSATTPYKGLIVWGAQLETGSGASSYIPTGASQGTRNPDNVVTAIANVTGFNANQGTMFQSWQDSTAQDTTAIQEWAFGFGLTSASGFGIYVSNAVSGTFGIFAGSSNTGDAGGAGTYVINGINKTALAINVTTAPNTGTISLSANGSAAVSGTRLDGYNQAQTLSLGQRNSNQRYLNGWIRQFKYWPYVLPNAQLQSLTT
jgi:hypothetical protein